MSTTEQWVVLGVVGVIALEVIRHYTWRPVGVKSTFTPIGMAPYTSVSRRA